MKKKERGPGMSFGLPSQLAKAALRSKDPVLGHIEASNLASRMSG